MIKTWWDPVRSLGVCHGQSTVIGRVLCVGITKNSVCLVAYHWQMDFSEYWTRLAVPRQCLSSGTAADGHTPYKARPSHNWPKITTYDHVHQILITSCTWFRSVEFCVNGALHGILSIVRRPSWASYRQMVQFCKVYLNTYHQDKAINYDWLLLVECVYLIFGDRRLNVLVKIW